MVSQTTGARPVWVGSTPADACGSRFVGGALSPALSHLAEKALRFRLYVCIQWVRASRLMRGCARGQGPRPLRRYRSVHRHRAWLGSWKISSLPGRSRSVYRSLGISVRPPSGRSCRARSYGVQDPRRCRGGVSRQLAITVSSGVRETLTRSPSICPADRVTSRDPSTVVPAQGCEG